MPNKAKLANAHNTAKPIQSPVYQFLVNTAILMLFPLIFAPSLPIASFSNRIFLIVIACLPYAFSHFTFFHVRANTHAATQHNSNIQSPISLRSVSSLASLCLSCLTESVPFSNPIYFTYPGNTQHKNTRIA